MPILSPEPPSAPVFYPKENYNIAKYTDITKFISLLFKQSLFFCRVDKLEDKFEGTSYKTNFEARIREMKQMVNSGRMTVKLSDDDILKSVKEDEEFEEKQRALHCINCWNKSENESAALWKIYSDFSQGIMIQSSILNIVSAFNETTEDIQISEVNYRVYNKSVLPYGNSNYPFLYKQKAYNYENEVRLIYSVSSASNLNWQYDWSKEEVEEGLYIKVDLNKLINKIVISPYSPKWFYDLIADLINKYGLDKQIEKSEFSIF